MISLEDLAPAGHVYRKFLGIWDFSEAQKLLKVAHDKDDKIDCKGKDKFWFGFKKHVCVDMQSGLINKVAITSANVTDGKGFKNVCPDQRRIYTDKAYLRVPFLSNSIFVFSANCFFS